MGKRVVGDDFMENRALDSTRSIVRYGIVVAAIIALVLFVSWKASQAILLIFASAASCPELCGACQSNYLHAPAPIKLISTPDRRI